MSSGLRLVTSPSSTTTSRSTQVAPAFLRSVWMDSNEVNVRRWTTPASISVQGAWQMAATGLPLSKNDFTNRSAFSSRRSVSAFITPPGSRSAS